MIGLGLVKASNQANALPMMLIMLTLFRVYISRATRTGHFSRWMGASLVIMYVAYTVVGYVV